jgi:hypothetical protein
MLQTLLDFQPRHGRCLKYGAPFVATETLATTKQRERGKGEELVCDLPLPRAHVRPIAALKSPCQSPEGTGGGAGATTRG